MSFKLINLFESRSPRGTLANLNVIIFEGPLHKRLTVPIKDIYGNMNRRKR